MRTAGIAAIAAAMVAGAGLPSGAATPAAVSPNLLKNGTAEAAPGGTGRIVKVPNWTRSTGKSFTAVKYGSPGFPSLMSPAPHNPGKNFFAGGGDVSVGNVVAVQTIPLSKYVAKIKGGHVTFTAAGWFGGKAAIFDQALIEVDFKDANGFLIGTSTTVGGVTAANRHNVTGLLHRLKTAAVPKGARSIYVQAIFEHIASDVVRGHARRRASELYNNAYMDNVTITLAGV